MIWFDLIWLIWVIWYDLTDLSDLIWSDWSDLMIWFDLMRDLQVEAERGARRRRARPRRAGMACARSRSSHGTRWTPGLHILIIPLSIYLAYLCYLSVCLFHQIFCPFAFILIYIKLWHFARLFLNVKFKNCKSYPFLLQKAFWHEVKRHYFNFKFKNAVYTLLSVIIECIDQFVNSFSFQSLKIRI